VGDSPPLTSNRAASSFSGWRGGVRDGSLWQGCKSVPNITSTKSLYYGGTDSELVKSVMTPRQLLSPQARAALFDPPMEVRADAIVAAMVVDLRQRSILLPSAAVLEKIGLAARARARKQAYKALTAGVDQSVREKLDALIQVADGGTRSAFAWLREWSEAPLQKNLAGIVERLQLLRALGIEPDRERRIHRARYAAIARETPIHYTDTGGATEHVFGLCHLLGFRFAPRLRDLTDRRLYVADGHADHGALDSLIGGVINLCKIEENWDETLRMTASIRAGTVAPSVLLRRLAAYPRQNALARALREIGCLERTLFILDWISDPALRRRSNAGLNKGEARNALARALFFHRHGEIRDRTFENQRYRASGLNLTIAAVILWNTVYLGHAVAELRAQGETLLDTLLAHIGPLGWEHLSFNGDYVWPSQPFKDGLRPLRNSRSAFLDPA
jgi:Tn3 transposase DDE domain